MRFAFCVALLALAGSSCGSGSGDCGPVLTDAARPNTLPKVIAEDVTLRKSCSPYNLQEPLTVAAGTLTLEAGVVIEADQGAFQAYIMVGENGKLVANGGDNDPVIFTSFYRNALPAVPIGGQWAGLLFLEAGPGSSLHNVRIEYGGGPVGIIMMGEFDMYEFPDDGSLLIDSSEGIALNNVTIDRSRGHAIAATTSEAFEDTGRSIFSEFTGVTITNPEPTVDARRTQGRAAVWLPVDQMGLAGPLSDMCFFEREDGACPTGGTPPTNAEILVHVDDELGRTPEDIRRDATWNNHGVPYIVENINVTNNALLTITDGVEIRMTNLGGIYAGLNDTGGAISMIGDAAGGIKITTLYEEPVAQSDYWKGLYIWNFADVERTIIQNVDVSYGGRSAPSDQLAPANIGIWSTNPTIIGNHVSNSLGMGISWNCLANPKGLEVPPLPDTNTSDDPTIRCAQTEPPNGVGIGIAENYACVCPGTGQQCLDRCQAIPPP